MKRILLLLGLVILSIVSSYSALSVNNCRSIVESDLDPDREILLTQSIDFNGSGTCFDIEPNDISFNCQGNYIDGNDTGNFMFFSNTSKDYTNISITNCNLINMSILGASFEDLTLELSNSNVSYVERGFGSAVGTEEIIYTQVNFIEKLVPVSSCGSILTNYPFSSSYLTQNISNLTLGAGQACIRLVSGSLDCQGHTIESNIIGVSTDEINNSLRNCNIKSGSFGFEMSFSSNDLIENIIIEDASSFGFDILGVTNSIFRNITILPLPPVADGFFIRSSSHNNLFEDIVIYNATDAFSVGTSDNNTFRNIIVHEALNNAFSINSLNTTIENLEVLDNSRVTLLDDYTTISNSNISSLYFVSGSEHSLIQNSYLSNFSDIIIQSGNWSDYNITFQGNTFLTGTAPANECFDIPYNTTCNTAFVPVVSSTSSTASLFPVFGLANIIIILGGLFLYFM